MLTIIVWIVAVTVFLIPTAIIISAFVAMSPRKSQEELDNER